jgi:oleate hydratase
MKNNKDRDPSKAKVYLIGSGIASLASALYLEKDAGVLGKNIRLIVVYFFHLSKKISIT